MSLISAERFIALKDAVKKECARRAYTGSVAEYAGTNYDYVVVPSSGAIILKEHYEKIATPLNAITGNILTNPDRSIREDEIANMESLIETLSSYDLRSSTTGCGADCTGLCSTACSGGCSGSCGSKCSSGCTGDCAVGCKTSCRNDCGSVCGDDGCTSSCSTACTSNCNYWCQGSGLQS